jgi:CheY-like chemotaxis protein
LPEGKLGNEERRDKGMNVRALVGGDDVDLRDTWGHLLGQGGLSCLTASTGSEAMQARDTGRAHEADVAETAARHS